MSIRRVPDPAGAVAPGADKYYGTDATESVGFHDVGTGGGGQTDTVVGQHSVENVGDNVDAVLELVGDVASPGNDKFYGTDSGGDRGWQSFDVAELADPATYHDWWDDFLEGQGTTSGELGRSWTAIAATLFNAGSTHEPDSDHPGTILGQANPDTAGTVNYLQPRTFGTPWYFARLEWWQTWVRFYGSKSSCDRRVGIMQTPGTANLGSSGVVDGAYFECLAADTNWFSVTQGNAGGSSRTRKDTGVAYSAGTWRNFRIVRTGAQAFSFYIGDTLVTSHSSGETPPNESLGTIGTTSGHFQPFIRQDIQVSSQGPYWELDFVRVRVSTARTSGGGLPVSGTIASLPTIPVLETKTIPIVNAAGLSSALNVPIWRAPFACTVLNVRGYRVGGSGATVNARKNGSLNHLASALSLTSANTWLDGGTVQNASYAAGDSMEAMLVSATGGPTIVAIQIEYTRNLVP